MGTLLVGYWIRLPVVPPFIPASGFDSQSRTWGKCFHRGTYGVGLECSRVLTLTYMVIQLSWFYLAANPPNPCQDWFLANESHVDANINSANPVSLKFIWLKSKWNRQINSLMVNHQVGRQGFTMRQQMSISLGFYSDRLTPHPI